jgi:hypothetical protein
MFLFIFIFSAWSMRVDAQNNERLIGHWELDRITLVKEKHDAFSLSKEELKTVFKTVLLQKLVKEEPIIYTELEDINKQAEELASLNYESVVEIQSQAIYNRAQKSLSGEYLVKGKELMVEWSNAEKNNFKILKLTGNELVLKDIQFNLVYYYNRLEQEAIDKEIAKLKKAKELACTKPDPEREAAEKAAKEKFEISNVGTIFSDGDPIELIKN